jgi:transcription elongation factor Elf1
MTSLSKKEFLYLCRKVDFENNYRRRFAFAKIIESKKIAEQVFELYVSCPHCSKKNKQIRINFNLGSKIVCEHCYQRFFINVAEFRFGNISQIYQYYYLSLKKIILYNAAVHRLLFPLPNIIEKMAALSRSMVNLIMSGSNLLFHQRK